ncbi:hypothetical protein F4802DRAFT_599674 [Xylaria palmicola]|nr:hypothetical protein F4802DRAFT_599674 [Xylaria palmicola]
MGSAPASSDRSLLERLNALKPTSVSLTSPLPSASGPASTIERAGSPSREDALTARLKSLRNQGPGGSADSTTTTHRDRGAGAPTQWSPDSIRGDARSSSSSTREESGVQQGTPASVRVAGDVDPLYTDDQTLEELLEDLRSDDAWLDELVADEEAEEEEHGRVTALLIELSKSPSGVAGPDRPDDIDGDSSGEEESEDSSSDDGSGGGGDVAGEAADAAVARAVDEVAWEAANKTQSPAPPSQQIPTPPEDTEEEQSDRDGPAQIPDGDLFHLPAVPSRLQEQADPTTTTTSPAHTQADADTDTDTAFAASIAARMAALALSGLRELLPPTPTGAAADALGLPQAPSFAPADRPVPVPGIAGREDDSEDHQKKTWCVVCLEDGAVRCRGCDPGDDVYCARCWKAMHVGPRAGYDERGHAWEAFAARPR